MTTSTRAVAVALIVDLAIGAAKVMAFFLTGSLMISGVVNYYNRKMMLVER